jgi:hypothetical protein
MPPLPARAGRLRGRRSEKLAMFSIRAWEYARLRRHKSVARTCFLRNALRWRPLRRRKSPVRVTALDPCVRGGCPVRAVESTSSRALGLARGYAETTASAIAASSATDGANTSAVPCEREVARRAECRSQVPGHGLGPLVCVGAFVPVEGEDDGLATAPVAVEAGSSATPAARGAVDPRDAEGCQQRADVELAERPDQADAGGVANPASTARNLPSGAVAAGTGVRAPLVSAA